MEVEVAAERAAGNEVLGVKANPKVVEAVAGTKNKVRGARRLPKIEKSSTTINGAGLSC